MDFLISEIEMLVGDGYTPGYMGDIQVGDIVAIAPSSRFPIFNDPDRDKDRHVVKTRTVIRIENTDSSYHNEDGEYVTNRVVGFIGLDLNGLPHHEAYSHRYPCFIKREES